MSWDKSVDLLIVGSGNGAMTAAICARDMGTKDILLVEKGSQFGGTSALSGGGVWVPCNRYAKAAGVDDSFDEAKRYLMATTPEGMVPESMIDAYLMNAPKMIDFLHNNAGIRYQSLAKYPDYFTDQPGAREGHRSMEPEPIDLAIIGENYHDLLASAVCLFDRVAITQVEAQKLLVGKAIDWAILGGRLFGRHYLDLPWVLKYKQSRRGTLGIAGIVRLWIALQTRKIPLWLQTTFKELIVENGAVVGAIVEKEGRDLRVRTKKGVILAAGGFEKNQQMRKQYLPKPTNADWSAGCKTNTGDAIRSGQAVGAQLRLMDNAWWCTTLCIPGKEYPWLNVMTKSLPGSIVVNKQGKRFSNESQNYMSFLIETFKKHTDEEPCVPAYMIFDDNFKKRYPNYPLMFPNMFIPRSYLESGFAAYDNTLTGLATKMDIDPQGLQATVDRFNQFAQSGKDLDLGRGNVAYDRYYGDPLAEPNPCLGPIIKPPFYAMKMEPGDFGTQGGLAINENAQVINEDNEPIPGLYACGNCSAAVLPTYPGPGSTLGPAMTFGYQAAKHLNAWQEDSHR